MFFSITHMRISTFSIGPHFKHFLTVFENHDPSRHNEPSNLFREAKLMFYLLIGPDFEIRTARLFFQKNRFDTPVCRLTQVIGVAGKR